MAAKWKDQLFDAPNQSGVYNMPYWLSLATMNAVGEGMLRRPVSLSSETN